MIIINSMNMVKPPCPKCPYALGMIEFIDNPCPVCKLNNYETYNLIVEGRYKVAPVRNID